MGSGPRWHRKWHSHVIQEQGNNYSWVDLIAFIFEVFNYLFKKLVFFFRQIFLKSIYFSSCKIPENQESTSLMVTNKVMSYTDYTMTPSIQKVFIATCICIWSTMYIIMLIHTYVVYDSRRTLFDFWEQRWTCSLNFASFLCTETHPSFVIRWWYHHSCCQCHKEDLSNSWIKDTRWKVMIILGYWTLHHFHTQTLQSLHLDWWYLFRCGNGFWRIYTDFWVQIWQVKVNLRVLKVVTDDFVSVG